MHFPISHITASLGFSLHHFYLEYMSFLFVCFTCLQGEVSQQLPHKHQTFSSLCQLSYLIISRSIHTLSPSAHTGKDRPTISSAEVHSFCATVQLVLPTLVSPFADIKPSYVLSSLCVGCAFWVSIHSLSAALHF